ncbi:MAG TPA: serine/threonine-protein kinase, partial [Elusimicrobiales bacterium]|nr:serine/threonine-protein kinase [Elusimicrobiales bacterium]
EIKVNDREKQRFLDEARTVALLHHPNIVEIYTIFEEEDDIYLVFEYVEGRPLDRILDADARIPFERVRFIFDETAKALAYAHAKGVVHRDLKLSNIMLSDEDGVKVMDFGLARRAKESMALLSNKEVVGSPAYMAPEQELGVSTVESDIYSLGVCLYESLSGVLPFQGPDFHHQKTHKSCQALSSMVPGLPAAVDTLLDKCLAPEPEKRFRSVAEFRKALNEIV